MQKRIHGDSANEEVAVTLQELGMVSWERDDLQAAELHLTEALSMQKRIHGDSANEEVAFVLHEVLGMVFEEKGDLPAAEQHHMDAQSIAKDLQVDLQV